MKEQDSSLWSRFTHSTTFSSLQRHHNYRLYFSGQFLSQVGTWLQTAAMAWLVLQLTHSAFDVGMLTFWQFGPYLALGLFGGAFCDRFDHRITLIATQIALALCSGIMALLTLLHVVTVWEAFLIAALRGIILIFNNPSRQAFIVQMVGRKELPNAIALNSSLVNASRIIGPGLSGLLIAGFGVGICFAIDALSYVAVIISLFAMHIDELIPIEQRVQKRLLQSIGEGFRYTFRTPPVLLALSLFMFVGTASINFNVLLPLVASDTLRANAVIYGLLTSCFGAGALVGALIAASLGRANWRILLTSAAIFGASEIVLAIQHTIIGTIALLLVTGISYTIYTANTNTIVQLFTPGYLQGRVGGLYTYLFAGSNAPGSLLDGELATIGGTQLAFLVGGATALLCTIAGLIFRPRNQQELPGQSLLEVEIPQEQEYQPAEAKRS
jgi:Arabinose efflux permease